MSETRFLYALIHAPREEHEAIVREGIAPLARDLRASPDLETFFFVRANKPDWHIRLGLAGSPDWVLGAAREALGERLSAISPSGRPVPFEFAPYDREAERFGGEEGVRLAERASLHDTLACLDWIEAESEGLTSRSRREYSLVMTERFLDRMLFTREERIHFYRYSYSFEIDLGRWQSDDLGALERHYRSIREGLLELFRGETSHDPRALWGGEAPARIACSYLERLAPILEEIARGQAAGTIRKSRINLAWPLTHLHANRLQIEADAEAILRYFMHRLHEEESILGD